jgi:hypothetical protein
MPNKENIEAWVTALESGEYEQAESALKRATGYCCLGVACELAAKAGVINPASQGVVKNDDAWHYTWGEGNDLRVEGAVLPGPVQEWLGVDEAAPFVTAVIEDYWGEDMDKSPREIPVSLIDLNDDHHFTFDQIAEAIRDTFLSGE